MTLHNSTRRRTHRLARLFTIAFTLFLMLNLAVPAIFAQEMTPEAPTPTETVTIPAESPAEESTAPPATEDSAPEEIVSFTVDPTPEPALPTEPPVEPPVVETAVPEPTGATGEAPAELAADGLDGARVRVITASGSESGPRIPHVCVTISGPLYGIPEAFGCTDANGEVMLETASSFTGAKLFIFRVSIPAGYTGVSDPAFRLVAGSLTDAVIVFTPLPPVTETLRTLDAVSGAPVGGACWSYYDTPGGNTLGDLAIGPVCDDDQDGTVTVTGIPHRAFCVVLTPPNGHTVVGSNQICTNITQRPTNITKALNVSNLAGSGSLSVTVKATWGEPIANVCVQAALLVGGESFSVNSACTDGNGIATIQGLLDGSYTASALSWPFGWDAFSVEPFTVAGGGAASAALIGNRSSYGNITFTTLYAAGPATVGGSCWSISTTAPGGSPANYYEIANGICDTDGDGVVQFDHVPYGAYCFTLTPPAGYYRTDRQYAHCMSQAITGSFNLTVGVVQIPVTPTVPASPTPSPTPVTPPPTPTPVPSEPIGTIRVTNCADAHRVFADGSPNYELCQPVGAGVRFAVMQNGAQIATVTTTANGTIPLTLSDRSPYALQYLDGNSAPYIPAPGQNALLRYDSLQTFIFIRDPESDHTWTFTLRVQGRNDGFTVITPLGGACGRVVGEDNVVYLPEVCDTDNDGTIVIGQLAPRYNALQNVYYRIELTQPPAGYPAATVSGGMFDPNRPNDYTGTVQYVANTLRIHIVDGSGNPVLGYCLEGDTNIYGGYRRCDGPGLYGSESDPLDGVIIYGGLVPGVAHTFRSQPQTAGWTPDTDVVSFSTTTAPYTDVYYRVHPSGASNANQADVLVQLTPRALPPGWNRTDEVMVLMICYRITGGIGNPASGACASASGEILFHNVPQGNHTLTLAPISVSCAGAPASVAFSVGPDDLGGTVQVPVEYVGCGYKPTTSCTVMAERALPGRTVDLYYGQMTGPDGAPVLDTLQLSETIPSILRESLLGPGNPDPIHITSDSLRPWSEPYVSGTTDWSVRPDWDGNAYQRMLDAYRSASSDYTLDARISHGSYQFISGSGIDIIFVDGAIDLSLYPECSDDTGTIMIIYQYQSTVNIYELNAAEPREPAPVVTPIPSPVPMCDTRVTRSIDLYYGSVSGLPYVSQAVALSDYIPPALRDVMLNASAPGPVRTNIGAWVDADLDDGAWAERAPDGIDAGANQRSQLANSGATVTAPIDEGVTEYRFVTYRYLDATELPAACRSILLAADEAPLPSMSVLVPVLQTTVVQVHYYQMNAVYGGGGSPTPTPTVPAGTTPTPDPGKPGSGAEIRGLPNTGAGFGGAPTGNLWLMVLAMLLGSIVLTAIRRGRPRM